VISVSNCVAKCFHLSLCRLLNFLLAMVFFCIFFRLVFVRVEIYFLKASLLSFVIFATSSSYFLRPLYLVHLFSSKLSFAACVLI
jgi:hypothetical protein